jgi:acetyl esterase/lipase
MLVDYQKQSVALFLLALLLVNREADPCSAAEKPAPIKADLSYGPHPHQIMDVYVPAEGAGPFPVLIWYGGLWKPAKHVPDVGRFFKSGCAVIGVQTRVMQDAIDAKIQPPISVCLLDGRRAVQFVRQHAREWKIDPDRIVVGGGSQGALPALYVGCTGEKADANAGDPVDRVSSKVRGVGAWRSQPTIDPQRMQQWVPDVQWGAPAFGCSFPDSLKRREEFLPWIKQWSPDHLLNGDSAPIYFENNWGLTRPDTVEVMDYKVHAPQWGLGFQALAQEQGVPCYVKYPDHPSEKYADLWDFLVQRMKED